MSVSRSAGLARWMTSLSSPPRPARPGAQLAQQDREALPVGQPHDVVEQVDVDRRAVVLHLSSRSPSPSPSSILASCSAPAEPGLALHEALTDQPLQADLAARVRLERREVLVVDLERDRGLVVVGHVHVRHDADRHAGHLHVLALHHRRGVVEDRAHEVVVRRVVVGGLAHDPDHDPGHDRHEQADVDQPSHGPGGTSVGIAALGRERGRAVGRRLRGGARAVAAGCPARSPRSRRFGGTAGERAAREDGRREDRLHARVVAVGVVVARHLGELRDPARRGRACSGARTRSPAGSDRAPGSRAGTPSRSAARAAAACAVSSVRSLLAPGLRISSLRSATVGRASATSGRSRAEERRQLLGGRLRLVDQQLEVVERGAQVHERRVGLAQRARQQLERALERRALVRRSPPSPGWCSTPGRSGRRAARRCADTVAGAVLDEAREQRLVERQLARSGRVVLPRKGAKYLVLSAASSARPSYCVPDAADQVAQARARLGVERVEEHVEVDRRARVVGADAARRRRSRPRCWGLAAARCSGWRYPTARWRGSSPSCPRAAARGRPRPPS